MDAEKLRELKRIATDIRIGTVEAVYCGKSGHPGGALSSADVLACLYFNEMNVDPQNPNMEDRDRMVLSKGHSAPGLYAALAHRGYFPVEDLRLFRKSGSYLQGHPDLHKVPGVDMSAGSLGQGMSAACGMALSAKISGKSYRVYSIVGDGESQEGQIWEAAMFAAHYKLDNLCVIVDKNKLQIDGFVEEVMNPNPHDAKFEAFGWNVITVDGHDIEAITAAFEAARACKGKPTVILADTVKGKGVSYMENRAEWHGKAPNEDQYKQAVAELEAYKATI